MLNQRKLLRYVFGTLVYKIHILPLAYSASTRVCVCVPMTSSVFVYECKCHTLSVVFI